jgi:hypothetical protein
MWFNCIGMADDHRSRFNWQPDGNAYALHYGRRVVPVLHVVPDQGHARMYRIAFPGGALSDLGNLSRIRDAALDHAIRMVTTKHPVQRRVEAGFVHPPDLAAIPQPTGPAVTLPSSMAA